MTPENSTGDGDGAGSYTEPVATRFTPKTKRRFDRFKEAEELSNGEALRRLCRAALEDRQTPNTPPTAALIVTLAVGIGWSWVAATQDTNPTLTVLTGVYLLAALLWTGVWPALATIRHNSGPDQE